VQGGAGSTRPRRDNSRQARQWEAWLMVMVIELVAVGGIPGILFCALPGNPPTLIRPLSSDLPPRTFPPLPSLRSLGRPWFPAFLPVFCGPGEGMFLILLEAGEALRFCGHGRKSSKAWRLRNQKFQGLEIFNTKVPRFGKFRHKGSKAWKFCTMSFPPGCRRKPGRYCKQGFQDLDALPAGLPPPPFPGRSTAVPDPPAKA